MPHWAWVTLAFGLIVGLFGLLLRLGGSEPRDKGDEDFDHHGPGASDDDPDGGSGHH
jgi:hypothetical protein